MSTIYSRMCWKFLFSSALMLLMLLCSLVTVNSKISNQRKEEVFAKEYLIQISSPEKVSSLTLQAKRFGLQYVEQVSPNVHVFTDYIEPGGTNTSKVELTGGSNVSDFREFYKQEIHDVQVVKYSPLKQFRQQHSFMSKRSKLKHFIRERATSDTRRCAPFYGLEIEEAWTLNFTGTGVNIGILDVGVEVNHPDLKQNINLSLAYNFANKDRRRDVNPVYDRNYFEAETIMDHGNNIAGLIAAVKGNDLCCRGVAFNATIIPLVVFRLIDSMNWIAPDFDDRYIPTALVYRNQDIHIYSNSYNHKKPFAKPKISIRDSLLTGIRKGRKGQGSIFVFSLGDKKDGLHDGNMDFFANSIYTITIGSIAKEGLVPEYSIPCSCILASALSDGKTIDADNFMTTSHSHSIFCTNKFKGSSAATGIGAAIIALGLHDRLSWRDVQHILVLTSSLDGLTPKFPTTVNGAGLKYNPSFGYGKMNATAFAIAAASWIPVPSQLSCMYRGTQKTRLLSRVTPLQPDFQTMKIEVKSCKRSALDIRFTEHVVANIEFTANRERLLSFKLCSPSETCSFLLNNANGTLDLDMTKKQVHRTWNFTSVQFWGESPVGTWTLLVTQYDPLKRKNYRRFSLRGLTLYIHGTYEDPFKPNADRIRPVEFLSREEDEQYLELLDLIESNETFDQMIDAVLEGDIEGIIEEKDRTGRLGHYRNLLAYFIFLSLLLIALLQCCNILVNR